jgi:hypothetical protein
VVAGEILMKDSTPDGRWREDMDDAIDFPCAPGWVHHYGVREMTRDYPDAFYQGDVADLVRREVRRQLDEDRPPSTHQPRTPRCSTESVRRTLVTNAESADSETLRRVQRRDHV